MRDYLSKKLDSATFSINVVMWNVVGPRITHHEGVCEMECFLLGTVLNAADAGTEHGVVSFINCLALCYI